MRLATTPVNRVLGSTLLAVISLIVLFPLAWTMRLATRPRESYLANPSSLDGGITWDNFEAAWNSGVGQGLLNSLIVMPAAAILATALAALAGYAFARLRLPGQRLVLLLLAATFAVPVTALAVPIFDQALLYGYLGTYWGLILVYTGLFTGWATLFLTSYFSTFPSELLEAAAIDGASKWRSFISIGIPLGLPAIVTVLVMNFFMMWSDLIIALVMMPTADLQTVAVTVATLPSARESTATTSAAAALLMLLPVLLVFAVAQRWLRSDVIAGAVKS
jgi:ABC-type glycerol-3-phosphate transport system permease component